MSMILRNAKQLRLLSRVGWKAALGPPKTEVTGVNLEFYKSHSFQWNIVQSYATNYEIKPKSEFVRNHNHLVKTKIEESIQKYGQVQKAFIEDMLTNLQTSGTMSSLEVLLLIRCCAKYLIECPPHKCISLVKNVWELSLQLTNALDVSHYNALLSAYLEKNHDFSPSEFLQDMQDKKVEPNRITYQRLIAAYCHKGDINGATKILEIMKEKELPLCENIFNSLIIGHSEANDMENAVGILKIMQDTGVTPSADTYTALLCAYAKRGDLDTIVSTINDATRNSISFHSNHFLEVYYQLIANGHLSQAEKFLDTHIQEVIQDIDINYITAKLVNINCLLPAMNLIKKTSVMSIRRRSREIFLLKVAIAYSNIEIENIIDMTREIEKESNNSRLFQLVAYHSLKNAIPPEDIFKLFEAWRENGGEIREHYFWPILKSQANTNDYYSMEHIIKTMKEKFHILPTMITLQNYVIPFMFTTWQDAISGLKSYGVSEENACIAIAKRLLIEKKLKNFIAFVSGYPQKYPKEQLLTYLVKTYIIRDDAQLFLNALRLLEQEPGTESRDQTPIELIDESITILLKVLPHYKSRILISLIQKMEEIGLSISPNIAEQVKIFLADYATADIVQSLENLSSGTLHETPMSKYNFTKNGIMTTTVMRQNLIPLRQKFTEHLMNKDTKGIIEVIKEMEKNNVQTSAMYAQAIDVFCQLEDLEAAENYINKLNTNGFLKLDYYKILKYLKLLVKNGRVDDALCILNNQPNADHSVKVTDGMIKLVHRLLDSLVELKDVENLNKMFDVLKTKNLIIFNNFSLGPLVKIHVLNDNIEKAVEVFEKICIEHECTPYKNSLVKELIKKEDAHSLQKITDLCSSIYGENNALVDLAFIFIESDRIHQARKILETPYLQIATPKVKELIKRLVIENQYENLEKLPQILKNIIRIDRNELFNSLLDVYIEKNDWKRGLSLWTEMQEYEIQPTPNFLSGLTTLLNKNNQPIPFIHTSTPQEKSVQIKELEKTFNQFDESLSQSDNNVAKKNISSDVTSQRKMRTRYESIILTLLNEEKIDEALDVVKRLIHFHSRINQGTFTEMVNKLIAKKRLEDLEALGSIMSSNLKDHVSFDKLMSLARISIDGLKNYLEYFELKSKEINSKSSIESIIHFGGMVHGLLNDPSCLPIVEKWADDLEKQGIERAKHVLWNYYFIKNLPEAENLWKNFVGKNKSPLIRPIIEYASMKNDEELVERFHATLSENPKIIMNTTIRTLSELLKLYNKFGRYDDALNVFVQIQARFNLNLVPNKILHELKTSFQENNKDIPPTLFNAVADEIKFNPTEKISAAQV